LKPKEKQRIDHIDSIRGIAALTVVFIHGSDAFIKFPSVEAQGTLFYDLIFRFHIGMAGVMAFFAISGFVICPTLKGPKPLATKRFLISRFFRLYPPFWASMLLYIPVAILTMHYAVDWDQVLGNLPILYTASHVEPVIGVYWTLEVELVFYVLCLLLFLCGWLDTPFRLFIVGVVLMAIYQGLANRPELKAIIMENTHNVWIDLPRHLAIMFWGGLFRMWYDDRQRVCTIAGYQVPVIVLVIALAGLIVLRPIIVVDVAIVNHDGPAFSWAFPYIAGLGMFVVGALWIRITQPFFVWLGTISYSLYLLHPVVIMPLSKLVENNEATWGGMHVIVYILVVCVFSILLASLVYLCVEKPSMDLGHYLQRRLKKKATDKDNKVNALSLP